MSTRVYCNRCGFSIDDPDEEYYFPVLMSKEGQIGCTVCFVCANKELLDEEDELFNHDHENDY